MATDHTLLRVALAALRQQHEAIDELHARLVMTDKKFRPAKSVTWPAVVRGHAVIRLLEKEVEKLPPRKRKKT